MESLPQFTYYRNPYLDSSIENTPGKCACCHQDRTYTYKHSAYLLCPQCIANGGAAAKFGLYFIEPKNIPDDVPAKVIDELRYRTPKYPSWQSNIWKFHCGDACLFEGDLTIEEAQKPNEEAVKALMLTYNVKNNFMEHWFGIIQFYQVADPSIFKFRCRHCDHLFYYIDSP